MKTKVYLAMLLAPFLFTSNFHAQSSINATGGNASGTGGSASYSVGQIDFNSQTGSNGTVNQGVQQPLEFFNVGISENEKNFSILLFPNPTVAELFVDLKGVSIDQLKFILTDANGKQIQTSEVSALELTINMMDCDRGAYFLNFVRNGAIVGSYKVIKN